MLTAVEYYRGFSFKLQFNQLKFAKNKRLNIKNKLNKNVKS